MIFVSQSNRDVAILYSLISKQLGEGLPFYDPKNLFGIQVKSRLNNEFTGNDFKKTRWDVDYYNDTIALSRFQDLCIARAAGTNTVS